MPKLNASALGGLPASAFQSALTLQPCPGNSTVKQVKPGGWLLCQNAPQG